MTRVKKKKKKNGSDYTVKRKQVGCLTLTALIKTMIYLPKYAFE